MVLTNFSCDLRTAYRGIVPETVRHADELLEELSPEKLRSGDSFYTADARIYFRRKNTPYLALARISNNLCLRNLDDFLECERYTKHYRPPRNEVEKVLHHPDTGIFDLTKLRLGETDSDDIESRMGLGIPHTGYQSLLTSEELRMAEYVFKGAEGLAKWMARAKEVDPEGLGFILLIADLEFVLKATKSGPFAELSVLNLPAADYGLSGDIYFCGEPAK